WGNRLKLWSPHTGREVFRTACGVGPFGPNDRLLAVLPETSEGRAGRLIQVEAGREYRTLVAGATAPVPVRDYGRCSVHPGGRLLAVGTSQGVSLMDLVSGTERAFLAGHAAVLFEPSGALLTNLPGDR